MTAPTSALPPERAAPDVFRDLVTADAVFVLDRGRLTVRAPRGRLTPALRREAAASHDALATTAARLWRSKQACDATARGLKPCRVNGACRLPVVGRPCGVPATCCRCGDLLPAGRVYHCEGCSEIWPRPP